MTMSVYIIFPDLGNTKLHIFVGLSLPTPCALYSVLSCSVHVIYTLIWCTLLCFYHNLLYKETFFYSNRVSSDWFWVDTSSLGVSLYDLLDARSQKYHKRWRCLHIIPKNEINTSKSVLMLKICCQTWRVPHADAGCTLIWCSSLGKKSSLQGWIWLMSHSSHGSVTPNCVTWQESRVHACNFLI